jgi:transposase
MRDERRRWLSYEVVRRKGRGESERAIGRGLRIARKTVKRILNEQKQRREDGEHVLERELPRARAPRPSKLDPYLEQIAAWLEQFPDLTAVRLKEKLEELGFTGGYTICREHLQAHHKKTTPARAVQIVETVIGQQAQFDWSPYVLEGGLKVQLWGYTLSWSRGRSLRASDNTRSGTSSGRSR